MCKTQWGIDEYFLRSQRATPTFFVVICSQSGRSLVLLNMQKKQWSFIRQEEDLAKSGYKPEIKYKSLIIFQCLWLLNQNQVYQSGDSDWWVDSRLVQIVESGLSLENSLPVNGIQCNKLFTKTRPHTVSVSLDDLANTRSHQVPTCLDDWPLHVQGIVQRRGLGQGDS